MNKRKLWEIEVSSIGYGCMGLSHGYGALPSTEEAIRLIHTAHDLGCTFFDTAEGYGAGANEEIVGKAIKSFRGEIVLATKVNPLHMPFGHGELYAAIEARLSASLKRLGSDYVDLYYLHRIPDDETLCAVAAEMGKLITSGEIRGWGISQANERQIRLANSITPLSAVQNEFSMMERKYEQAAAVCNELNIGFVPFSPLASGFLSGKYQKDTQYSGDDVRRVITRFAPENVAANQPLLDMLRHMADTKGATPAQISLAWMLHKLPNIVPIPGMRSTARICENLGAADVELSEAEYQNAKLNLPRSPSMATARMRTLRN